MEKIIKFTVMKFPLLLIVSLAMSIAYLVASINDTVETIHFTVFENYILFPIVFAIRLLPFALIIGLSATAISAYIKSKWNIKGLLFDFVFYLVLSGVCLIFIPTDMKSYFFIPIFGFFLLAIFENIPFEKRAMV